MKLYEIILPIHDNSGASLTEVHTAFRRFLCDVFGGYTWNASQGVWRNEEGRTFTDSNIAYRVASPTKDVQRLLLSHAAYLFIDQEAFFITELGASAIVERSAIVTQ